MASIEAVHARQILDSRGNPTVEVEVVLDDGSVGRAGVPSRRVHRRVRGGRAARRRRRVRRQGRQPSAVDSVVDEIQPELLGHEADDQRLVDQALIDLDRTPNKSRLGANAIIGVSMAVARAAADSAGLQLFRYLGGPNAHLLPVPMMNILNGGAHADSNVDVQEFMIAPIGAPTYTEALRWGAETYHALKAVLKQHGLSTGVGDEGGFAPNLEHNRAALDLIVEAIGKAGFTPGRDIALAIDAAATEFYNDGAYHFDGKPQSAEEMIAIYSDWVANYPIVCVEDPLAEEDWAGWQAFTAAVGDRVQIVGDDLFVTNPERLRRGIAEKSANALLVKVNQIGTVSETFDAVQPRAPGRLRLHDQPPLGRDRRHLHRRPRRRHQRRPDQDRRARPAASGSPSTTSCCASRSTSATPRSTRARARSRGSPPPDMDAADSTAPAGNRPSPAQAAAMAAAARPTRLTGRAALLAVVICAIALSLAYPVREYIAQRQQIDQLLAPSRPTRPRCRRWSRRTAS